MDKQEVSYDTLMIWAKKHFALHQSIIDICLSWGFANRPAGYYPAHIETKQLARHGILIITWGRA